MGAARKLITFGGELSLCEPARRIVEPTPAEIIALNPRRPTGGRSRGRAGGIEGSQRTPLTIVTSVQIVEWWRSDFGISQSGGFVDSWTGAFGNQWTATLTARPAYNSTDAAFNGRPSLAWDGSNDEMSCALAAPAPGTTPRFYWIIVKNESLTAGLGTVISGVGGTAHIVFRAGADANNQLTMNNGASQQGAAAFTVGAAKLVQASFSNSASDFLEIGASPVSGINTLNNSAASLRLGSFGGAGFAQLRIAEVLITQGAPSPGERGALKSYAGNLNGVTVIT